MKLYVFAVKTEAELQMTLNMQSQLVCAKYQDRLQDIFIPRNIYDPGPALVKIQFTTQNGGD